jgi:hypothetical protein
MNPKTIEEVETAYEEISSDIGVEIDEVEGLRMWAA